MASAAGIPIIDVSSPGADERDIAGQLVDAAKDHGFIYIKNSGRDIAVEQIEGAFDIARCLPFTVPSSGTDRC